MDIHAFYVKPNLVAFFHPLDHIQTSKLVLSNKGKRDIAVKVRTNTRKIEVNQPYFFIPKGEHRTLIVIFNNEAVDKYPCEEQHLTFCVANMSETKLDAMSFWKAATRWSEIRVPIMYTKRPKEWKQKSPSEKVSQSPEELKQKSPSEKVSKSPEEEPVKTGALVPTDKEMPVAVVKQKSPEKEPEPIKELAYLPANIPEKDIVVAGQNEPVPKVEEGKEEDLSGVKIKTASHTKEAFDSKIGDGVLKVKKQNLMAEYEIPPPPLDNTDQKQQLIEKEKAETGDKRPLDWMFNDPNAGNQTVKLQRQCVMAEYNQPKKDEIADVKYKMLLLSKVETKESHMKEGPAKKAEDKTMDQAAGQAAHRRKERQRVKERHRDKTESEQTSSVEDSESPHRRHRRHLPKTKEHGARKDDKDVQQGISIQRTQKPNEQKR